MKSRCSSCVADGEMVDAILTWSAIPGGSRHHWGTDGPQGGTIDGNQMPYVFDFENIEGFVVHKDYRWPRLTLNPQAHRLKLRVGPLKDCCRLP